MLLALTLSAALSVGPVPANQDSSRLPSRTEVGGAAGEQVFLLVFPGPGSLHVGASSVTVDPRLRLLTFDANGELLEIQDDDGGGGTTAYASVQGQSGQEVEVVVEASTAQASEVTLHTSWSLESEASLEQAEALGAELRAVDLAHPVAASQIDSLSERLVDTQPLSPRLVELAQRLTTLPRKVRTVETEWRLRRALAEHGSRHLPPDHPTRLEAFAVAAAAAKGAGRLDEALDLEQEVLAARRRLFPEGDRSVLIARLNVAATRFMKGDLAGSAPEFRALYAFAEENLAESDVLVAATRQNLAAAEFELGYVRRASELYSMELRAMEALPEHDLRRARLRLNHAQCLVELGEFERADRSFTATLEALEAQLPEGDPLFASARLDHGETLLFLGDEDGARFLFEQVLEAERRADRGASANSLAATEALADLARGAGELDAALASYDRVLEARLRDSGRPTVDTLLTRLFRASTLRELGRGDEAVEEYRTVLREAPEELAKVHRALYTARTGLGVIWTNRGELDRARPIQEELLRDLLEALPATSPRVQRARTNLAWTLVRTGEVARAEELLRAAVDALRERLSDLSHERTSRELAALASRYRTDIDQMLSITGAMEPGQSRQRIERDLLGLIESVRAVEIVERSGGRWSAGANDAVATARAQLEAADAAVLRHSRTGGEAFVDAVRARDEAQRALRRTLASAGTLPRAIDLERASGTRAVAYWRYSRSIVDEESGRVSLEAPHYLAFVIGSETTTRIELGPAGEIDDAVQAWRREVLLAGDGGRGVTLHIEAREERSAEAVLGERLRELLIDPARAAFGDAERLVCLPDDALFLVPFDALPEGEGVVGDALRVTYRLNLAPVEADAGARDEPGGPILVAMGGIDYDELGSGEGADRPPADLTGSLALRTAARASAWQPRFPFLPGSVREVAALVESFEQTFPEGEVRTYTQDEASRTAFERTAPRATFLHLATHAYFAPESVPSMGESRSGPAASSMLDTREQVRGFAPMILCGLAFAGANTTGPERFGSLLTAEELAALDLRRCELAVLSACETNLGVRRAGQGVASLQSALHAAGVQSSVASLWSVSDSATKELMERFYRALWEERRSPVDALWTAKAALREARADDGEPRYGTRDWAGWVLVESG